MAKAITFINEKGGIGKTSLCFNLAWELSKKKKVLMIDMDGQRANLTYFCGVEKTPGLLTIMDLLRSKEQAEDVIVNIKENLDLICATSEVTDIGSSIKPAYMKSIVESLKPKYDYIFLDVSPNPDWRHVLTLSASDYLIAVMLPDIATIESNKGIMETLETITQFSNPNLKVLGIVFNKNETRTNMGKSVRECAEYYAEQMGSKIFKTTVRNAAAMGEFLNKHIGITDYSPKSNVAEDIRNLAKELEREVNKHGEI